MRDSCRMKTASVGEARHNLSKLREAVSDGEELVITRRSRVVARLVPPAQPDVPDHPDFTTRAREMVPNPRGAGLSRIVLDDRAERV